jgi:hypothetical protein
MNVSEINSISDQVLHAFQGIENPEDARYFEGADADGTQFIAIAEPSTIQVHVSVKSDEEDYEFRSYGLFFDHNKRLSRLALADLREQVLGGQTIVDSALNLNFDLL